MVKLQLWFLAQKFKYSYLHVLKSSKLYKLDFSPIWKDLKLKIQESEMVKSSKNPAKSKQAMPSIIDGRSGISSLFLDP